MFLGGNEITDEWWGGLCISWFSSGGMHSLGWLNVTLISNWKENPPINEKMIQIVSNGWNQAKKQIKMKSINVKK